MQEWNETTGTGIVSYDFTEDTMVYVSASKGFKAGGFNVSECEGPFDPETIWAYELGAKFKLFDNRLQLNGATFVYKYDDIQVNQFVNNASSITNAAEADIYGAELEFVALVGDGFEFDGGVTYLNTEYGGGATFSNPILGGPPISVDGNDTLRSPPWKTYIGGAIRVEQRARQIHGARRHDVLRQLLLRRLQGVAAESERDGAGRLHDHERAHRVGEHRRQVLGSVVLPEHHRRVLCQLAARRSARPVSVMSQYSAPRTVWPSRVDADGRDK